MGVRQIRREMESQERFNVYSLPGESGVVKGCSKG